MRRGILGVVCAIAVSAFGQDAEVKRVVALVNDGRVEEARQAVPALLEQFPNNPGVLYAQGLVTREGAEAARIYQSIVDNFPRSAYADAALHRVYQFYYSLGLYRTAELKMAQLKRDYPSSRYLKQGGQEIGRLAEEVDSARVAVPPTPSGVPEQQTPTVPVRPPEPATVTPTAFSLQAGAYAGLDNAEKQKALFSARGFAVEIITKVRESKTLHVVLVGRYASYDEAKARGAEIKRTMNVDCMVIPR